MLCIFPQDSYERHPMEESFLLELARLFQVKVLVVG
jgi:hypothetical protein